MGVDSQEATCLCSGDALRSNFGAKTLQGGCHVGTREAAGALLAKDTSVPTAVLLPAGHST